MTTGSRASALVAIGAALVLLAALIWSALSASRQTAADNAELRPGTNGQPAADGAAQEPTPRARDQQAPLSGPTPTVRWETPPKFGGRGGDYSEATARLRFRPGPYR